MQPVPRSSAVPCSLADPATHPSLQFVAGELDMGRVRKRTVEEAPAPAAESAAPTPAEKPPAAPVPAMKPSTLPAPSSPTPVFAVLAPPRKRATRSERRTRRRMQAARLRVRWRKVAPYFGAQLSVLALAVVLAEWVEVRGGQPLLCRFIAALATSLLAAPLWLLYLRRRQTSAQ